MDFVSQSLTKNDTSKLLGRKLLNNNFKNNINEDDHERERADLDKNYNENYFQCSLNANCSKIFSTKKRLESHIKLHNEEKIFKCSFANCNKSFSIDCYLKSHLQSHVEIRNHICHFENCSKSFSKPNRLKIHLRTHLGEKPFSCKFENCNKSFNERGNLKTHERIHTGEKPFQCDKCVKKFKTKGQLLDHRAGHEDIKTHKCSICTKYFARKKTLTTHYKTHKNEKQFKCEICGKSFCKKCTLNNHMKCHTRANSVDTCDNDKIKEKDPGYKIDKKDDLIIESNINFHETAKKINNMENQNFNLQSSELQKNKAKNNECNSKIKNVVNKMTDDNLSSNFNNNIISNFSGNLKVENSNINKNSKINIKNSESPKSYSLNPSKISNVSIYSNQNIEKKHENDELNKQQDSPMSRFSKHIQDILSTETETLNKEDAYNIINQYFSLANSSYNIEEQNRNGYVNFLQNITTLINKSRELSLRKAQMVIDIHIREKELQNLSNTFKIFNKAEDLYRQLDGIYNSHIDISPFEGRNIYNLGTSPLFNNNQIIRTNIATSSKTNNSNFVMPSTFTFSDYINQLKNNNSKK